MRSTPKPYDARTPFATTLALLATLALSAGLLAACAPGDPAEEIEEARSRYSAELASFAVDQRPAAGAFEVPPAMDGDEGMEGEDAEAAEGEAADDAMDADAAVGDDMEGDEMTAEHVDLTQDVILDILLSYDGHDALPGVTVDVTHIGPSEEEKGVYKVYLDTSDVHRGPPSQMSHRLEDVPYEEDDGFHVEVRSPIPAAERSEYQEFSETGEGS